MLYSGDSLTDDGTLKILLNANHFELEGIFLTRFFSMRFYWEHQIRKDDSTKTEYQIFWDSLYQTHWLSWVTLPLQHMDLFESYGRRLGYSPQQFISPFGLFESRGFNWKRFVIKRIFIHTSNSTHFALCHGVEALEGVVGWVVDVEELPQAGDHVLVALANCVRTSSNWIGTDNFIVDNIEVVVRLIWNAARTVIKSDTAVTLSEGISV